MASSRAGVLALPGVDPSQTDTYESGPSDPIHYGLVDTTTSSGGKTLTTIDTADERIDEQAATVQDARAAFAGKTLDGSNATSFVAGARGSDETPLEQFNRLQAEVKHLEQRLAESGSGGARESEQTGGGAVEDGSMARVGELVESVRQLSVALDQIGNSSEAKRTLHPAAAAQEDGALVRRIKSLVANGEVARKAAPSADAPTTGEAFDLFFSPADARQAFKSSLSIFERRLASLEQLVGESTEGSASLSTEVDRLEERLATLDVPRLEQLQQFHIPKLNDLLDKASIRSRAFQKANANKPNSANEQKIDKLFDNLERWEEVAERLPSVVARLQSLQRLHQESALVHEVLADLDKAQTHVNQTVASDTDALKAVRESLTSNFATVQGNVEHMQARMAALEKRLEALQK